MQIQDIEHIGEAEAFPKDSGVVMGLHPDTLKPMLSNGTEHILLVGPARSGKGINTVIPTGLVWKDSAFFFDPKGELWANTAGFRKEHFHQKVLKFEPLCTDGSGARWNPLAEINYRSVEEFSDVSTMVSAMVNPDGEKQIKRDPFWDNSAVNLLKGVILHLMYKHHKEALQIPSPTDIMSFLSSPDKCWKDLFADMMTYPHIRPEEFLEEMHPVQKLNDKGDPVFDAEGNPVYVEDLDKAGNPQLVLEVDKNGNLIQKPDSNWKVARDRKGNILYRPKLGSDGKILYKPRRDEKGEILRGEDGKPVFEPMLDANGTPVKDDEGNPVYEPLYEPVYLHKFKTERYINPLRQIYGNYYVPDLTAINEKLTEIVSKQAFKIAEENRSHNEHKSPRRRLEAFKEIISSRNTTEEKAKDILENVFPQYVSHDKDRQFKITAKTIPEIQSALRKAIQLGVPQIKSADDFGERDTFGRLGEPRIADAIDWYSRKVNEDDDSNTANENPVFYKLLVHPRVADAAATIYNGAESTCTSIIQTAKTALSVYDDPVVQRNMCVSDFCIRDLQDPKQEISLYFVTHLMNFDKARPIARLFVKTLLNKLVRNCQKTGDSPILEPLKGKAQNSTQHPPKKGGQRLLLMFDEFLRLGNMESVEVALAICAAYGIKMCIVCQSLNQLNNVYTEDNVISSNCRIHIYFAPNPDSSRITATTISKLLGKQMIPLLQHHKRRDDCNSIEFKVREVMTSDEVNCLFRSDKVFVFMPGHSFISCNIFRYYTDLSLSEATRLPCPTISDTATQVLDYDTLFPIHADDREEMEKKSQIFREVKALHDGKPSLKKITGKTKTKKEIILPSNEDEIEEKKEGT